MRRPFRLCGPSGVSGLHRLRPWCRCVLLAGLPLLASGCATFSENFASVERHLAAEDVPAALAAVDKVDFPARDKALYFLNKGMLQRMAGDYRASAGSFESAKGLLEEFGKLSLREQTLSLAVNDASRAYEGQPYELLLLHAYAALNYLQLGDFPAARVESLQLDQRLREMEEGGSASKVSIRDGAFARYLSGLIYEALGENAEAMIAYRKAYEAYERQQPATGVPVPRPLQQDLLRLAAELGLDEELRRLRKTFPGVGGPTAAEMRELGEVVFILHNGLTPGLREQSATVLDPTTSHFIRLALPSLVPRPLPLGRVALIADGIREDSALVEDVAALARKSLDERLPGMTARLLARQVVKAQASRQATKAALNSGNDSGDRLGLGLLALGVELSTLFSERADTRHWATLPGNIQLVRLPLPPGRYRLRVQYRGAYDQLLGQRELPEVQLAAGRKIFLSEHRVGTAGVGN